ncbi:MAG: GNAT family protein [Propioniciclava sp.]|uniref:GNAT family N-acetyltransferase n=1 Tax=Propioniciclava sp. TaxID=2038686 RepID=UPI0039E5B037
MSQYRLRSWRSADAPVLLRSVAEPEFARDLPPLQHLADAKAYVAKLAGDDDLIAFAIVRDDEDGDIVLGGVHARIDRVMRTAWVSYWLLPDARGLGLGSRATVALADHLFRQDVHRLEVANRLVNVSARRVAERAGFIPEGIMRSELEIDGVRYDTTLMSRLVTDPAPATEPLPGLS